MFWPVSISGCLRGVAIPGCLWVIAACALDADGSTDAAADKQTVNSPPAAIEENGVTKLRLLPPGPGNPRNSEGDFIQLRDGRILFVYTHFTGGRGDHAAAHLAGRFSSDGGKTWTAEDVEIVPREGDFNVMSVSLLRLQDGRIALFYLRKNSTADCRLMMRVSTDEAQTWSEPTLCMPDEVAYFVVNNDRVVQLESGRLIAPAAHHTFPDGKFDGRGQLLCFLSDDNGKTWRRSKSMLPGPTVDGKRITVQEPGVVELKDGRVMLFCRTNAGVQYLSYSKDGGNEWSPLEPSSIRSPLSPATIERIPSTGDLLLVWNHNYETAGVMAGRRTPFNAAISQDDGRTWKHIKTLDDDPEGWYCYTAMEFVGDDVLLAHCAGNRKKDGGLSLTQITRFPVAWLYETADED